ncbi:MAG: hypothetical protein QFX36_01940 [Archaeoglobales archaeon]|nr:hypothetical protein [Archaeoglobales archaeon]
MKKEKLLVLAKTYPVISRKYEHLVCVAGLTEDNNWRRIYPIPWELFWKGSEKKFKKKTWIEYELVDDRPSDRRPESRKIDFESIKVLDEEDFREIKRRLDEKLANLDELEDKDDREVSLSVIKPILKDFVWTDSEYFEKVEEMSKQITLGEGKSAVKIDVPDKKFQFVFRCCRDCKKTHTIMCEDWEMGILYIKMREKDPKSAPIKVRSKFYNEIPKKGHLYFILGTHNIHGSWLIISVVYPKQNDLDLLRQQILPIS